MRNFLLCLIFLLISCDSDSSNSGTKDEKDRILGSWQTQRDDNCVVITTFNENDTIINTRNLRVIKGTFEFSSKNDQLTLVTSYTFDDENFAQSCAGDQDSFNGQTFTFPVRLSEDENTLNMYFLRSDPSPFAVLIRQE